MKYCVKLMPDFFAILMTMINARLCMAIEEVDSLAIIQINRTQ